MAFEQIAIFNHKGGVSKTTTAFHLGWKLAERGKRVLLVDTDPQCNLTGLVLNIRQHDTYPYEGKSSNIRDALSPAFDGRPVALEPVKVQEVPGRENLFVLPGHVGLAEYESSLAIAHELSGSLSALQNLPGAMRRLFEITAKEYAIDIAIIDMSPSLGAINQNVFMSSDKFIIPMAPDYFSAMALRSLARVLPKWKTWSDRAAENEILKDATYPWPETRIKYIGAIVQNYRRRSRGGQAPRPTKAYQRWFDELTETKASYLIPALSKAEMLLSSDRYIACGANLDQFLLEVPDFNSLIASSQDLSKPVFSLTTEELGTTGVIASDQEGTISDFNEIYRTGAEKVECLIGE